MKDIQNIEKPERICGHWGCGTRRPRNSKWCLKHLRPESRRRASGGKITITAGDGTGSSGSPGTFYIFGGNVQGATTAVTTGSGWDNPYFGNDTAYPQPGGANIFRAKKEDRNEDLYIPDAPKRKRRKKRWEEENRMDNRIKKTGRGFGNDMGRKMYGKK